MRQTEQTELQPVQIHVVRKGETLYGISRQYGVPTSALIYTNPHLDMYRLLPGDQICIPGNRIS